ncbi:MAG: hypothetical protein IJJ13_01585 [Lachnospiraceae bacterium]|nr:hypothetical protein [Lachnospiraceae bacterium]
MKVDRELKKGIAEMRCGGQNGFVVFFNKTFQFTCLWTTRLMSDTVRRDDFLSEFYPYALLHIADLTEDENVFPWLERMLPVFYEIWTGSAYADAIRIVHPDLPDDSEIRASASIVWNQISKKLHFPEKQKKQRIPSVFILLGFAAAALFLVCILVYQKQHIPTANQEMIDRINEENLRYSTDSELNEYLMNTHVTEQGNTTIEVEEIIHEPDSK